jgi:DNA-binding NtrC family response regulator
MQTSGVDIGNVRALRPLRVLLAARDRRFLRVAGFLLARHGFVVESTKRPRELLALIEKRCPDVVILDGSDSLGDAARTVGAIEALHPHVTVIVMAEDAAPPASANFRIFPKWTSLEELVMKIERMHLGVPL